MGKASPAALSKNCLRFQQLCAVFSRTSRIQAPRTVALFAEDQTAPIDDEQVIQVRLKDLEVRNARQWSGCWLACELYEQLKLDQFWAEHLPPGRKGTRWELILQTLCIYRFIDPGSEWRLHRYWFDGSAVADLLGSDFRLAESHRLYGCHDFS